MLTLKLETLGLEEARKFYRLVTRRWRSALEKAMARSAKNILKNMKLEVPVSSGQLKRSLWARQISKYSWRIGPSPVRGVYGANVEKGRRAGSKAPPLSSPRFQLWLSRHGIPKKRWYAVARSIGRKGIKPNPFMSRAFAKSHPRVFKDVNKAVVSLIRRAKAQTK